MTRLAAMLLPQRAGILATDPAFREFVACQLDVPGPVTPEAAAQFIRQRCNIASRRDLATNPDAAAAFERLRTDFDAARGRIAAPRP